MADFTSSIKDHIDTSSYDTYLDRINDGSIVDMNINGEVVTFDQGNVGNVRSAITAGTSNASGTISLIDYAAPTSLALDSFYKIGQDFDNLIKDTFLAQTYYIRGPEILCSMFCILVSFLSCEQRGRLNSAIYELQQEATAAAQGIEALNELTKTANATMSTISDVSKAASDLFSNNTGGKGGNAAQTLSKGAAAYSTIQGAAKSVEQVSESISRAIEVFNMGKIQRPVNITNTIWNLARAALYALQSMALQFADEALNKIIKPVEDLIKEWIPSECSVAGYASVFFKKLLDGIYRQKQWVLQQIAELFNCGLDFNSEFTSFNNGSTALMELKLFVDMLKLASHRFGDLAIACGVTPCNDLSDDGKNIADAIKHGTVGGFNPVISHGNASPIASVPTKQDDIREISDSLAGALDMPTSDIVTKSDTISFTYTLAIHPPKKIKEFIDEGALAANLTPDYGIFAGNDEIKVVYTFNRLCGE